MRALEKMPVEIGSVLCIMNKKAYKQECEYAN